MSGRPRADAKAGTAVYGRSVIATVPEYENEAIRKALEQAADEMLMDRIGKPPEWSTWAHFPASFHIGDDGGGINLPELWTYTCEVSAPEGLIP